MLAVGQTYILKYAAFLKKLTHFLIPFALNSNITVITSSGNINGMYWTPTAWNHMAITFSGSVIEQYVNRTLQTTGTLVTAPSGSQIGYVGSLYNGFNSTGNINCFSFSGNNENKICFHLRRYLVLIAANGRN